MHELRSFSSPHHRHYKDQDRLEKTDDWKIVDIMVYKIWALCVHSDIRARASLVGTTSNAAGAILRARETLLITGLLVSTGRLGRTSGTFFNDVALVDGVLLVGL